MESQDPTPSNGGVPAEPLSGAPVAGVELGFSEPGAEHLRWVEPGILEELEAELDGPELARGFARDYASLWEQRFGKLAVAVQSRDRTGALDAVISLRIASVMVGGIRLAVLAQALEDALRKSDFVQCQVLLERVGEHGIHTVSELQTNYILKDG